MNLEANIKLFTLITDNKWKEFTDYLIKTKNIDVNIRDKNNNYLINYAVIYNKPTIVTMLINKGAKLDIIDSDGYSLLYIPIKFNFLEILDSLLKANDKIMGVSLLDIKDKNGDTALHYGIKIKNLNAVSTLLKYGSDVNKINNDGSNALHTAVQFRVINIAKRILEEQININARTYTGETALHIACNFELKEIVDMLIDKKINVNIKDYDYEYTALNYAIKLSNLSIINKLISNGADMLSQDYYGDTPLHFALKESNYEVVNLLINSYHTKNIINYNLYNIDSEIPFHLLLKKRDILDVEIEVEVEVEVEIGVENKSNNKLVSKFIKNSNLNFQNKNGVTPLHILCKKSMWITYKDNLLVKKLNIFVKNNNNKRPIDYIDKNNIDSFIDLIIDSYLYRLRTTSFTWKEDWENICKKQTNKLTTEDLKILSNYTKKKDKDICREVIRNKLLKAYKDDNIETDCDIISYPIRKYKKCINIDTSKRLEFCTFTGINLDILFGLINLLNKHSNTCSILDKEFIHSTEVCDHYRSLGIDIDNTECGYLNFEVLWTYYNIFFSSTFDSNFKKCLNNKNKRFIIVPMAIEIEKGAHSNYLLYDKKYNEVERFEPYGTGIPPEFNYNPKLLDSILKKRFKKIDPKIKYLAPDDYLSKINFQQFDSVEKQAKKIGDPGGFCALWAMWYINQRLTYPDINREYLVGQLLKNIRLKNLSFKNLIRNYSREIIKIRDDILNKIGLTINDMINEEYTQQQYFKLMNELIKLV